MLCCAVHGAGWSVSFTENHPLWDTPVVTRNSVHLRCSLFSSECSSISHAYVSANLAGVVKVDPGGPSLLLTFCASGAFTPDNEDSLMWASAKWQDAELLVAVSPADESLPPKACKLDPAVLHWTNLADNWRVPPVFHLQPGSTHEFSVLFEPYSSHPAGTFFRFDLMVAPQRPSPPQTPPHPPSPPLRPQEGEGVQHYTVQP